MQEFREFAEVLAEESGAVIRKYFRSPFAIDMKQDESPVTIADRKAEEVMRELIMKEYPGHGIVGEEGGDHRPQAEYQWVLDPIDGTLNFVAGGLMFGTLIALLRNGEPILGLIHQPVVGELVVGDNEQAIYNGRPVRVRQCRELSQAVMLTTDPYLIKAHKDFAAFERLRQQVQVYRGWGDCYGYLLLAVGSADIMIDPIMKPWDIMALIPIVRGAGGVITDYHGNEARHGSSILATAGPLHSEVLAILNSDTQP